MDEYLPQVQLKPKERIFLSEDATLYKSYTESQRRLRASPGQPRHTNVRRWTRYNGWLFLTNERILFVAKVGVFRRSTKIMYTLLVKRIVDLKVSKVFLRGVVVQVTSGQERKRFAQFSVRNPDQLFQAIQHVMSL